MRRILIFLMVSISTVYAHNTPGIRSGELSHNYKDSNTRQGFDTENLHWHYEVDGKSKGAWKICLIDIYDEKSDTYKLPCKDPDHDHEPPVVPDPPKPEPPKPEPPKPEPTLTPPSLEPPPVKELPELPSPMPEPCIVPELIVPIPVPTSERQSQPPREIGPRPERVPFAPIITWSPHDITIDLGRDVCQAVGNGRNGYVLGRWHIDAYPRVAYSDYVLTGTMPSDIDGVSVGNYASGETLALAISKIRELGTYTFTLTVSNSEGSASDTVTVTVVELTDAERLAQRVALWLFQQQIVSSLQNMVGTSD